MFSSLFSEATGLEAALHPWGREKWGVSKAHPDEPIWFSSESKARQ